MAYYKILVWSLVVIPTVIVMILCFISPHSLSGINAFDRSFILSLLGTSLSYYGLIFSSYAALQVQAISDVYFFKIRSPELHKKLEHLAKLVAAFGAEPSNDLRSQAFLSEAAVAFRLAKRFKNKHVKKVAKEAEESLQTFKTNMVVNCVPGKTAGQIPDYWEFYQKLAELVDELNEQLKDAEAHS